MTISRCIFQESNTEERMAVEVLTQVPQVQYLFLFDFEKSFSAKPYRIWMQENWTSSIFLGALYVALTFSIKTFMKKRNALNLRPALVVWSAVLAIFSIIGTLRTVPELFHVLQTYGIKFSVCNPSFYVGPTGFWVLLYTWSKVYELGDTLFIVFRKQPLIFLHWYHHLATMIYTFLSYKDFIALGRWGITMNYTIHAIMYSHYTLRALRIRVPRVVSVILTSLQLTQMALGVSLNAWTFLLVSAGEPCQQTYLNNCVSFLMYLSYLALFANFFHNKYIKKKI